MKISSIIRPLALLGILILAAPVNAQEVMTPEADQAPFLAQARVNPHPRMQLSDEQLEKLRALKDQFTLDTAAKKAELKVQRGRLMDLLSKAKVDKQEVLALQAKNNALKAQLSDARVNFLLAAGDVLTPEQKEQFRHRMLSRTMKFGGGGRGGCGGHHRGHFRGGKRFGPGAGGPAIHGPQTNT